MVSIEDNLCSNCGERFLEHPEIRAKKREMHAEIKRDVGSIVGIVTVILSLSLLIITLMLDNLHRWIRPIEQDGGFYLILMTSCLLVALVLFIRNMKIERGWGVPSRTRKLVPYVILAISGIGTIMVLFAEEIDRFLSSSTSSRLPILVGAFVIGIALLAISKGHPSRKRDGRIAE
jgi:hypothetical protein